MAPLRRNVARMTTANANPLLQDKKWVASRYESGMKVTDIAAEAGCDPARVWVALRRHKIPLRGRQDVPKVHLTKRDVLRAYKQAGPGTESSGPLGNRVVAAQLLGVHETTLREWEARLGLRPVSSQAVQADELYRSGLTLDGVAEAMGYSRRAVQRLLVEAGTRRRPAGRPKVKA